MTISKICLYLLSIALLTTCAASKKQNKLKYDAELSQYKYPFPVYDFTFKSQNQNLIMRYGDLGRKNKKVAVLLHGKNFSGYYWNKIANDLLKKISG